MSDFSRESMLDMFIFEMNQLVDQLEQLIIECEDGYSVDNINEIFRIMHTIKGSAAMMLFDNISKTAHAMEDLFFYLREENPSDVDYSKLTDHILEGMDLIKNELAKIAEGEDSDIDPTEIINVIENFLVALKGKNESVVVTENTTTPIKTPTIPVKTLGANHFEVKLYFQDDSGMENVRAYNVLNNLKDYGEVLDTVPQDILDESSEDMVKANGFSFVISTDASKEQMSEVLNSTIYLKSFTITERVSKSYSAIIRFDDECEMENVRAFTIVHNLEPLCDMLKHEPEDIINESSIEIIKKNGFLIEFSISKTYEQVHELLEKTIYLKSLQLDEINIIEEQGNENNVESSLPQDVQKEASVTAVKNTKKAPTKDAKKATHSQQMISVSINKLDLLLNLMGELVISEAMTTQNPDLVGLELENFNKSARQLRKIIKDVQDSVMSMRMVTLDATFFKMQRIVRDMCKSLGKNINLVIEGRETEVDKNIIEHISDPLMHIIRNSVDHGIELPKVRENNGKDPQGTIFLEAKNSGGEILISLKDNGSGINKEKVLEKAISSGILKKPAEEYTDREIYQLIFHAGLSTKETVTSFSGRGVGMDVVTANIEAVGGNIIVDSEEGQGTTTILKIPLTLAIIDGMLISMGGSKYTIPISSIQETFKAKNENIFLDPDGNEMITLRGDVYNLVRLYDFFNATSSVDGIEDGVIIIIESETRTVCLFVDELIGEQQVVVKSIPKYVKPVRGISGCTLLGNGDISLIIDVAGFFDN